MAIYKITELHNRICEIANDGYEYVEVLECEASDDSPESLIFTAIEDSYMEVDYDSVESCEVPENFYTKTTRTIHATDYCLELNFTYSEIATIKHAVDNALEYFKDCLTDSSLTRDIIDDIKHSSVECRNLQAKLAGFLKHLK